MARYAGEHAGHRTGFTLIEVAAALAVAALLGFLLVAAVAPLLTAGNLSQAGDAVRDEIKLAAQQASANNGETDVMFYRLPDAGGNLVWRGVQVNEFMQQADGSSACVPLGRMVRLPDGIVVAASGQLSPLLAADPGLAGTATVGGMTGVPCVGFRFRARGEPEPAVTSANNFLTLQPKRTRPTRRKISTSCASIPRPARSRFIGPENALRLTAPARAPRPNPSTPARARVRAGAR